MRTGLQLLVLAAVASLARAVDPDLDLCRAILRHLSAADDLFKRDGPCVLALSAYELVAKKDGAASCIPAAKLALIYYKRALIELHLRRDASAIANLKKVLHFDPKSPARTKLVQLLVERGDFAAVRDIDPSYDSLPWDSQWAAAQSLGADKKWEKCFQQVGHVLETSPQFVKALELRYLAALHLMHEHGSRHRVEGTLVAKVVVSDLETLVRVAPYSHLDRYVALAQYLVFTQDNYARASSIAKNCLEIDNSHKGCQKISKFLARTAPLFEPLVEHAMACARFYDQDDGVRYPDPEIEWKSVFNLLHHKPLLISKFDKRALPEHIVSNYDLIRLRAQEFDPEGKSANVFLQSLLRFSCEAHVRVSPSSAKRACEKLPRSFFPKVVPRLDSLIRKGRWNDAQELLQKYPDAVHQLSLFQERAEKVQDHFEQQQQEQFFRQQQHHHHHQNHFEQQPPIPDVDYYKVLGVKEDADDSAIKKAYRALSLKYHPDKYKGTDLDREAIEKKMQEINLAKEVLTNKQQREIYDRQRKGGSQQGHGFGGGGGGFGGGGFGGFDGGFGGFGGDQHVFFDFSQGSGQNAFFFH